MNTLPEWAAHLVSHVRLSDSDSRSVGWVVGQLEEFRKQATAPLRDSLSALERTLSKLSVRAANAGCGKGFVEEICECAEAARVAHQEGHADG